MIEKGKEGRREGGLYLLGLAWLGLQANKQANKQLTYLNPALHASHEPWAQSLPQPCSTQSYAGNEASYDAGSTPPPLPHARPIASFAGVLAKR